MSRRRSIVIPGFTHANPIPAASVIDGILYSGALTGRDPSTGEMPQTIDEQMEHIFGHVRALLQAAGGSTDDIVKMNVHLAAFRDRAALNEQWLAMFPDPERMPARQVFAASLDGGSLMHCDLVAVLKTQSEHGRSSSRAR